MGTPSGRLVSIALKLIALALTVKRHAETLVLQIRQKHEPWSRPAARGKSDDD
jgi:hypothetical protein